jgi:hypothetical protein
MKEICHLNRLIKDGIFRFSDLRLIGIDNTPVLEINRPEMAQEETCLFHRDVSLGDQYFQILHSFVLERLSSRDPAPVVRFADGEYAFYANDLHCNGLYQQAESVRAIKKALPQHIDALRTLSRAGKIAPLIHPGNIQDRRKKALSSFMRRRKKDNSALGFVEFLYNNQVSITRDNYVPFYVIYAYLTSSEFAEAVDQRRLCIISSECHLRLCRQWFERFSSRPEFIFIQIPESYIATQWQSIRKGVMAKIPSNIDICLVGAGVGSLPVCVDVAAAFSVPAIDAGHILNMMNGREDKSNGPRLYTVRKGGMGTVQLEDQGGLHRQ